MKHRVALSPQTDGRIQSPWVCSPCCYPCRSALSFCRRPDALQAAVSPKRCGHRCPRRVVGNRHRKRQKGCRETLAEILSCDKVPGGI